MPQASASSTFSLAKPLFPAEVYAASEKFLIATSICLIDRHGRGSVLGDTADEVPGYAGPWRHIYATALDAIPLLVEKGAENSLPKSPFSAPFSQLYRLCFNVETIWLWFVVGNL